MTAEPMIDMNIFHVSTRFTFGKSGMSTYTGRDAPNRSEPSGATVPFAQWTSAMFSVPIQFPNTS